MLINIACSPLPPLPPLPPFTTKEWNCFHCFHCLPIQSQPIELKIEQEQRKLAEFELYTEVLEKKKRDVLEKTYCSSDRCVRSFFQNEGSSS